MLKKIERCLSLLVYEQFDAEILLDSVPSRPAAECVFHNSTISLSSSRKSPLVSSILTKEPWVLNVHKRRLISQTLKKGKRTIAIGPVFTCPKLSRLVPAFPSRSFRFPYFPESLAAWRHALPSGNGGPHFQLCRVSR